MTIHSATAASLAAVLPKAIGGDVIQLAEGNYDAFTIANVKPSGAVRIVSADPKRPAVFAGLMVKGSANLTFSDLKFRNPATAVLYPFQIYGSTGIVLERIEAHGPTLTAEANTSGLMIRASQAVAVRDCDFHDLRYGVNLLDNTVVAIAGNRFREIREDGVRGGGTSDLSITDNLFTDFHPQFAAGDHPDAIQLWTTNTKADAVRIAITGNVFFRGAGGGTPQGVFISGEGPDGIAFREVIVADNCIIGGLYNGITFSGVVGGRMANNLVVGLPDQQSWIRVQLSTEIAIEGNDATFYTIQDKPGSTRLLNLMPSGNRTIVQPADAGRAQLQAWLTSHPVTGRDAAAVLAFFGLSAASAAEPSPGPTGPSPAEPIRIALERGQQLLVTVAEAASREGGA